MKTEVYSWRVSSELKSQLEAEARARKVPVSRVLDTAVREWLGQKVTTVSDEQEQQRLQAAAAACFGTWNGGETNRASRAREIIRAKLQKKHGK